MNKLSKAQIVFLLLMLSIFAFPSWAENEQLDTFGDVGQWAIPLTAAIISWAKDDQEGIFELAEGAIYTATTAYSLKHLIESDGPNGEPHSFPSIHTAMAAQGAAYLQFRYGWKYGAPAYTAAAIVGYSRIDNDEHDWEDVIAGAAIATGIQYAVSGLGISAKNYVVIPYFTGEEAGLQAHVRF